LRYYCGLESRSKEGRNPPVHTLNLPVFCEHKYYRIHIPYHKKTTETEYRPLHRDHWDRASSIDANGRPNFHICHRPDNRVEKSTIQLSQFECNMQLLLGSTETLGWTRKEIESPICEKHGHMTTIYYHYLVARMLQDSSANTTMTASEKKTTPTCNNVPYVSAFILCCRITENRFSLIPSNLCYRLSDYPNNFLNGNLFAH